jgi:hypothetical protein
VRYVRTGLCWNVEPPSLNSQRYVSAPPCGSRPDAENWTSSGASPDAGSANASTIGASGSSASMVKATDRTASALPSPSVERNSTTCSPSADTVNTVSNGSSPSVFSERAHSPPSIRYSVNAAPPAADSVTPTGPS